MSIGQVVQSRGGLAQSIASLLKEILCHGKLRSRTLSLNQAESEYKAMADLTRELVWIQDILTKVNFVPKTC